MVEPRTTAGPGGNRVRKRRSQGAPAWLERARALGDPAADVLVARLVRAGRIAEIDALLGRVVSTGEPLPSALPAVARAFLDREGLPRWVDRARILRAQRFAEERSVPIAAALFCASLPMAFTGAKGASVLQATGRLGGDVDRRVNETGRFVFDVLMPGGFESGRAVRSIQKVRLLHASVRYRVLSARRAARAPGDEVPINQEDLLGTLFCFSVVVLDGLARMGVQVTPEEADDFFHLWRVTGFVIGIREEWLPTDIAEARRVGDAIRARQGASSIDGRALARVLVEGIERHLPARGLRLLAPGLIRYFLGEDTARMLGLPEGVRPFDLARALPQLTGLYERARGGAFGGLLPQLGRGALEIWMGRKLGGEAPLYEAPLGAATCPLAGGRRSDGRAGER